MRSNHRSALRFDAADKIFVREQLAPLDPTDFYDLVPGLVGRKLLSPVACSPGQPIYRYAQTKFHGSARRGGGRSRGGGVISVTRVESAYQVKKHDATMRWTVDEVRAMRVAPPNPDIPNATKLATVNAIEQQIDETLATGDGALGIYGLTNHPGIPTSTATIKTGSATTWTTPVTSDANLALHIIADVAQMLIDLKSTLGLAQYPANDGKPMFDKFVLIVPADRYTLIDTLSMPSPNANISVLERIQKFSEIAGVVQWPRLSTSGAGGTAQAMLAPAAPNGSIHPLAGGGILPDEFLQLPEQYEGWDVSVPCAEWCGGVVVRHAVAFRSMSGI